MPATLIKALEDGDPSAIHDDWDEDALRDSKVRRALSRAADCVVFHRPNYRETIARAVAIGVPCNIWTAARAGLPDLVDGVLSTNPDQRDATDQSGRTPLQRAALVYGKCEECEAVADLLIARGAAIDIFTAATFCLPDVVRAQLERDPELVAARCQGSTPLNWAVRPRRNAGAAAAICQTLIDGGADIHDRDEDESGMTPLHHAAEWGGSVSVALIDLLLAAGADAARTDDQGWTALGYAKDRGRESAVLRLAEV